MAPVWQDREIRFDVSASELALRKNEVMIDQIPEIEDSKGNPGDAGTLIATNLRLIWVSKRSSRMNLSVGYDTVSQLKIDFVSNPLRGSSQALYIMARFVHMTFQFIFASMIPESPRLFTTVQAVFRAYETSRMYRDLKLRGAIVRDGELMLLPQEKVVNRLDGVYNLASAQGNVGELWYTNVRVVWFARLSTNFSVSLPYMTIASVATRATRSYGKALVLTTTAESGGFMLGFSITPPERLEQAAQEMMRLHELFAEAPVFGVEFSVEDVAPDAESLLVPKPDDKLRIVDSEDSRQIEAFAAYCAATTQMQSGARQIVLSPELGLAIEQPPGGFTIDQLWQVVKR